MKTLRPFYFKYFLLISFLFTLIWAIWVMPAVSHRLKQAAGFDEMLDTTPQPRASKVYQYVDNIGEGGRKVLLEMYQFQDLIFPLAYGSFLFLLIAWLHKKCFPGSKKTWILCLIPLLMVVFDYIENFSMVALIQAYPDQLPGIAGRLFWFSVTKWVLGLISGIVVVSTLCILVIKKITRQQ